MTKQDLYDIIIEYYEHIYRRVLMFNDFSFVLTDRHKKQINNFIDFLNQEIGLESIGKEWIWNYLIYMFKERSQQKARYKDKIPLNWIVGKKAYELYLKKNDRWLYFNDLFVRERHISVKDFDGSMELKTHDYYEDLREQNYKKEHPLYSCLNIVPYSKKSKFCLRCVNKIDCKLINN